MPTGFLKDAEDVYEEIFQGQDYWLKLSAVWEMPRTIKGRYKNFLLEVEAMMPRLEKFHLIKDSPMLKGLSVMELMMFAEFIEIVDFHAADYVFKIGDRSAFCSSTVNPLTRTAVAPCILASEAPTARKVPSAFGISSSPAC